MAKVTISIEPAIRVWTDEMIANMNALAETIREAVRKVLDKPEITDTKIPPLPPREKLNFIQLGDRWPHFAAVRNRDILRNLARRAARIAPERVIKSTEYLDRFRSIWRSARELEGPELGMFKALFEQINTECKLQKITLAHPSQYRYVLDRIDQHILDRLTLIERIETADAALAEEKAKEQEHQEKISSGEVWRFPESATHGLLHLYGGRTGQLMTNIFYRLFGIGGERLVHRKLVERDGDFMRLTKAGFVFVERLNECIVEPGDKYACWDGMEFIVHGKKFNPAWHLSLDTDAPRRVELDRATARVLETPLSGAEYEIRVKEWLKAVTAPPERKVSMDPVLGMGYQVKGPSAKILFGPSGLYSGDKFLGNVPQFTLETVSDELPVDPYKAFAEGVKMDTAERDPLTLDSFAATTKKICERMCKHTVEAHVEARKAINELVEMAEQDGLSPSIALAIISSEVETSIARATKQIAEFNLSSAKKD
jgi:hypothetical protein